MKFITLFGRPDRLGTNITMYIAQLLFAHHHRYYIRYNYAELRYTDSCFVKYILQLIDAHNSGLPVGTEQTTFIEGDWARQIGEVTRLIRSDHVSQFKKIASSMLTPTYTVPFDPKKTIVVHLRLDDVTAWPEYDGLPSANYYREVMNMDQSIHHVNTAELPNHQSPLSAKTLTDRIERIKKNNPDREVVLITNPGAAVPNLPYRVLQNSDPNHDLFLLSVSEIVVLSRSTFSLAALFFGNHKEVHIPLIGFLVVFGFSTKYDRSNFIFF
jgi:hypothetical protein